MKYKILGLAALAVMLLAAAAAASLEPETQEKTRVHQHLTFRGDEGCGCGGRELAPDRRSPGGNRASPWGAL